MRVSKDGAEAKASTATWFETCRGATLLTMRVYQRCPCRTASIRSVNCWPHPREGCCLAIAAASFIAMTRRWGYASRQWICCVLSFKGRQRNVWGKYYTELFFLDEVTALAAGHRPCFECRRADALVFAERFPATAFSSEVGTDSRQENASIQKKSGERPSAPMMDDVLHAERLDPVSRRKRTHRVRLDDLPDGAMVTQDGEGALAVKDDALLPWTPSGYGPPQLRPRGATVKLLTPPSIVAVLRRGYQPLWHA